jgi:hypothetical protein
MRGFSDKTVIHHARKAMLTLIAAINDTKYEDEYKKEASDHPTLAEDNSEKKSATRYVIAALTVNT